MVAKENKWAVNSERPGIGDRCYLGHPDGYSAEFPTEKQPGMFGIYIGKDNGKQVFGSKVGENVLILRSPEYYPSSHITDNETEIPWFQISDFEEMPEGPEKDWLSQCIERHEKLNEEKK